MVARIINGKNQNIPIDLILGLGIPANLFMERRTGGRMRRVSLNPVLHDTIRTVIEGYKIQEHVLILSFLSFLIACELIPYIAPLVPFDSGFLK
jgi:hypothetical protein